MQDKINVSKKGLSIIGAVGFCILMVGVPSIAKIHENIVKPVIAEMQSSIEFMKGNDENKINFDDTGLITKDFGQSDSIEDEKIESTDNKRASTEKDEELNTIKESDEVEKKEEVTTKEDEVEAKTESLESIRIGSEIEIEEGRFFESPDGTGKYGHFENHQGSKKTIGQIGITTEDGYVSVLEEEIKIQEKGETRTIENDNFSITELQEMFPDGSYSYHIVEENDEKESILGWLTEDSFDQTLEQDNTEISNDIEER